jgi:hypothetical protein
LAEIRGRILHIELTEDAIVDVNSEDKHVPFRSGARYPQIHLAEAESEVRGHA